MIGTGIILAGGAATRMGLNKPLLPWRNGTVLEQITRTVAQRVKHILIVGLQGSRPSFPGLDVEYLEEEERLGPLGGISLGLRASPPGRALIVASDLPFICVEAIDHLWEVSTGKQVTLPRSVEGLHPLLAVYDHSCLPFIERALADGKRKILVFYDQVQVRELDTSGKAAFWDRVLTNINSPDEYSRALALDGQSPGSPSPFPESSIEPNPDLSQKPLAKGSGR